MKLLKLGVHVCTLLIASVIASGPLGLIVVRLIQPQVAWQGAGSFVANFNYIQSLPYFFGFGLIIGAVLLVAIVYQLAGAEDRGLMLPSLGFVSVYAALTSFNYILQTTFVPALALKGGDGANILISALSMSNPNSLAWALEMYGYLFLSLALLWLLPYFQSQRPLRSYKKKKAARSDWRRWPLISGFLLFNAATSLVGALFTSFRLDWVMTGAGLASFIIWNLIFLVLVALIRSDWQRQLKLAKA